MPCSGGAGQKLAEGDVVVGAVVECADGGGVVGAEGSVHFEVRTDF